jgi:hypothetical protein
VLLIKFSVLMLLRFLSESSRHGQGGVATTLNGDNGNVEYACVYICTILIVIASYVHLLVHMYTYVCNHVCMSVCVYVCMYACMHVCMCMYVFIYDCTCLLGEKGHSFGFPGL